MHVCTQVDTGGSAERAPCLVRTLCTLLRKVSLHALLKGAGKTEGGGAGGAGLHVDATEVNMACVSRPKKMSRRLLRVPRKARTVAHTSEQGGFC